ncbi:MAG TPA: hypothetical protein P5239_04830 [Victivallales bacterium]|nr:hypothetical protein [Victivallales bacterium]HRU01008.1 hypothetical protein [Victivallales bacterium]
MRTIQNSKLFRIYKNPSNGVESFILSEHIASVQKNFYYTNPGMTEDGRFLWFMCCNPNSSEDGNFSIACVDIEKDKILSFPETEAKTPAPMLDSKNGFLYWTNGLDIWRRSNSPEEKHEKVNSFPESLVKGRKLERIATHLSLSANQKSLSIDAIIGNDSYIGEMPINGSEFILWEEIKGKFHDHALFNPTQENIILFAHEFWVDHKNETFDGNRKYHRMWLIKKGEKSSPVLNEPISHSGHEWWSANGNFIYYVHYGIGVKKVHLSTRQEKNIWPSPLAHAHSSTDDNYLVADQMDNPIFSQCSVIFKNLKTEKEIIISEIPALPKFVPKCKHLHPHPQFCHNNQYICYTTTVFGRVDIALCPVRQLLEKTSI